MNKLIRNTLVFVALMTSFTLAYAEETLDLSDFDDAQEAQMIEMEPETAQWAYPIPYDLLMTSDYIVLTNKENLLSEDYIPPDLVKLTCKKISSDPIQMREVAANALSDMFAAAKEDGIILYAHSGYRSYRTQKTMYSNRLKKNNGKDDGVVAYPGSSDHQTGLGIDIINKAGIGKKFTTAFAETKEGKWVAENCWNYGFVIRYQKNKEDITQIMFEPWHLRYVGVQVAQYMHENDLSLEEFTAEWKEAAAEYQAAGN
ncbi:MAG: M15 family metallopeptidase [Christensenellales bacterium]|nr:M15 family metallopeptidase [Christensenellales bacterium]